MRAVLSSIVGLAALAVAHPADHTVYPRKSEFGCATEPTADFLQASADLAEQEAAGNISSIQANIVVPTYFHLVSAKSGEVTDAQLTKQLQVMNDNYAPYGISFTLAGTDKTINSQWANDQAELTMKRSLRKGDYKTLNVYFQTSLQGGALGYCYFPTSGATPGSQAFIQDGCVVLAQSVPGGSATGFNLGKTATHEIGHWFGLLHTFQGGCSGSGDSVADTPAQASPSSGCPTGRDSCAGGGVDPIHNYMDYSDDACYTEFTAGQQTRAYNMFNQYRA